jgi:hypothetical protein
MLKTRVFVSCHHEKDSVFCEEINRNIPLLGSASSDRRSNGSKSEERGHESVPKSQVPARQHRPVAARQPQRLRFDPRACLRDRGVRSRPGTIL